MKKIHVLRIIGECASGGTEAIALNYYKNFDHDQIAMDFLFYGPSLPRFKEELEKYGDKVFNVDYYSKHLIKSCRQIKKIVKSGNYDVVHSQLNSLSFFPLFSAKLGGASVRLASNHSTSNFKYEKGKSILKNLLKPSVKLVATDYAACSRHAGEWMFGKKDFSQGKVKIIYNALELQKFSFSKEIREKIRERENWKNKIIVGHVGRLSTQKNHMFLLDVFSEFKKTHENALLLLVSDGKMYDTIMEKVKKLELDNSVLFFGTRFDINELMQAMDIFVFPSLYEGLGNVINEAQTSGLPCLVSTNVPNEVDITDSVKHLSLNENAKTWAKQMSVLLNETERENQIEKMRLANYDVKIESKKLVEYYYSLIGKKGVLK